MIEDRGYRILLSSLFNSLSSIFAQRGTDAAEVGAVGERAADRIGKVRADKNTWVRSLLIVWVVTGQVKITAILPPAVLAADYAGQDAIGYGRPRPDSPFRALHDHPLLVFDPVARRGVGMELGCGLAGRLAQRRQRPLLAVDEGRELCVREHQRVLSGQLRPA